MAELSEERLTHLIKVAVAEAIQTRSGFSQEEASNIALAAATKAVNEAHVKMWSSLGYDLANKADIQRLRSNLDFMESLRSGSSVIGRAVATAIASAVVGAVLLMIWLGVKFAIGTHPPPSIK